MLPGLGRFSKVRAVMRVRIIRDGCLNGIVMEGKKKAMLRMCGRDYGFGVTRLVPSHNNHNWARLGVYIFVAFPTTTEANYIIV